MRDLKVVIDHMLEIIPSTECSLRNDLSDVRSSAVTAAPEMMTHWWLETCGVLSSCMADHDTGWSKDVADIMFGNVNHSAYSGELPVDRVIEVCIPTRVGDDMRGGVLLPGEIVITGVYSANRRPMRGENAK